jgi:hypothetical protein
MVLDRGTKLHLANLGFPSAEFNPDIEAACLQMVLSDSLILILLIENEFDALMLWNPPQKIDQQWKQCTEITFAHNFPRTVREQLSIV